MLCRLTLLELVGISVIGVLGGIYIWKPLINEAFESRRKRIEASSFAASGEVTGCVAGAESSP